MVFLEEKKAMILKPITDGKVSGAGTAPMSGKLFGGVLLSTDGTNAGVVIVRDGGESGSKLFDLSSKSPGSFLIPAPAASGKIYYSVTGTGASAQFYEMVW